MQAASYQKYSISYFISLWDLGTADEINAVSYLDAESNTLREEAECVGAILCPYMSAFF